VFGLAIGGAVFGFALIGVGLYFFCRLRAAEVYAARAKLAGAHSAGGGGDSMLATELQHRGAGSSSDVGNIGIVVSHDGSGIHDGVDISNRENV
jgi:hypothetical protein